MRLFSWNGRTQVHVSAVPLPFASLGDGLARALVSLADGRSVDAVADEAGLAPGEPRAAFARFVSALCRGAGVLHDPERPDPIHAMRPDERRGASLYLFPTNRCNLGCVYCYASSGPAGGQPLSVDDAALAIDRFFDELRAEVAHVSLVFHGGGEPTSRFRSCASLGGGSRSTPRFATWEPAGPRSRTARSGGRVASSCHNWGSM